MDGVTRGDIGDLESLLYGGAQGLVPCQGTITSQLIIDSDQVTQTQGHIKDLDPLRFGFVSHLVRQATCYFEHVAF